MPRYRRGSCGSARRGVLRWEVYRVCAAHRQRLVASHGLAGQMAQGKVDGLGLGAQAVAANDHLDVAVVDLDVGPRLRHTRTLHVASPQGETANGPATCWVTGPLLRCWLGQPPTMLST